MTSAAECVLGDSRDVTERVWVREKGFRFDGGIVLLRMPLCRPYVVCSFASELE